MSRKNLLVLGCLVLALGATAWGFAGSERTAPVGPDVQTPSDDPGAEPAPLPEPDPADAWDEAAPADDVPAQEVAICKLIPQCFKDVDCDAQCGAGNGNCVHNRCPVRICRCK